MRDASQAASAFTPQERTSVPYSIVRSVHIVRNVHIVRAYPSQKMPPVFAGGIVISILNGGVRRVRSGRTACLDRDCHPQAQT